MFVIPAGKVLGSPITFGQWWLWNQIPVTLGNIFSGVFLTGLALYYTFRTVPPSTIPAPAAEPLPAESPLEQVPTPG